MGAALTVLSGLILAGLNGYLHDAMTLSIGSNIPKHTAIGIGMWLGLIMAFNVWFVIWPNQKRALGIVECDPDTKAKSARTAMYFQELILYYHFQCCLQWLQLKIFIKVYRPLLKLFFEIRLIELKQY